VSAKAALIAALNRVCFGPDDEYSSEDQISKFLAGGGRVMLAKANQEPAAFLLYKHIYADTDRECLYCYRVGVLADARRQGLGLKLTRRAIAKARELGIPYRTYVLAAKLGSLNMHIRAGMRAVRLEPSEYLDTPWVHLST